MCRDSSFCAQSVRYNFFYERRLMKGHDKPLRFSVEITQSCDEISRSNLSHCHEGKAFKCKVPSKSLSTRGDPESLFLTPAPVPKKWLQRLLQNSLEN